MANDNLLLDYYYTFECIKVYKVASISKSPTALSINRIKSANDDRYLARISSLKLKVGSNM